MQNTVNLNLKKPDQNDFVNIGDINDNMDILDAEVAKKYVKPLAGIPSLDLDSATQAALKKAETALQTVTKSSVGLGNVDNTSDINKPVSIAQQVALDKKANLASPILTGTPTAPTAAESTNTQQIATTAFVDRAVKTHQADLAHVHWIGTAVGTNTLTATYEPITTLKNGLGVAFLNTTSSTLATTLNINGLGAIPILKTNGNPVTNLKANGIYTTRYANGNFILQGEGGEYGTAVSTDVLAGKTIGTDNGLVAGTLTLGSLGGKKFASGTVASTSRITPVKITGLTFKPNIVIMLTTSQHDDQPNMVLYAPNLIASIGLTKEKLEGGFVNGSGQFWYRRSLETNEEVNDGGFSLIPSLTLGGKLEWIAIG